MKLSICMMVKNEESNLERCLNSIQPVMNEIESEIVIVDTGSEDNTVQIARKYTNTIYHHQWNNNFSDMRNITISYAKGEWIYIIDADEEFEDTLNLIQFLKSSDNKKYNAGFVSVINFTNTEKLEDTPFLSSPRLFRRGNIKYEGAVHNQPVYKGPVEDLKTIMTHYGYITNDKELVERKFQRTSGILKSELEKDPENIYYAYQLSRSYAVHGDIKDSLQQAKNAYELVKQKGLNLNAYKYVLCQLAMCSNYAKEFKRAIEICKEGIEVNKEYIDLYFWMAEAQIQAGEYSDAIESYEDYLSLVDKYSSLAISKDFTIIMHTLKYSEKAYYNIISCYIELGEIDNYKKALEYCFMIESPGRMGTTIQHVIKMSIEADCLEELRNYYDKKIANNKEYIKVFIVELEKAKLKFKYDYRCQRIEKIFSLGNDAYSLINKMRVSYRENNMNRTLELINKMLANETFKEMPDFGADIIYFLMDYNESITDILAGLSEEAVNRFLYYLSEKYDDINEVIYKYLKNIDKDSFGGLKIAKVLERCILINGKQISDVKYMDTFNRYLKDGSTFVSKIYSEFIIDNELLLEVKNQETAFFILIIKANQLKDIDERAYISYLNKALKVYPEAHKGIGLIIQEIKDKDDEKTEQMEIFKTKVKENINLLISLRKIDEAKSLIIEYYKIVPDDMEMLMIESEIAVMKSDSKMNDMN